MKKILFTFIVVLLCTAGIAGAQSDNLDWGFNIDGVTYCFDGLDCTSDIIGDSGGLTGIGDLPASIDTSGIDLVDENLLSATGLGTVSITVVGEGPHVVIFYIDQDLGVDAYDENGAAVNSPLSGQTWEIDEPGIGDSGNGTSGITYIGDLLQFGFVIDGILDNQVFYDAIDDQSLGHNGDTAMALGWNFDLAAGETATITFTLGDTVPTGFHLRHTDPDSNEYIYFSSSLDITAPSSDDIIIDFGNVGLWEYKSQDVTLHKLHSLDVEYTAASGSKMAVDFGSGVGLWEYDNNGSSWARLAGSDPDNSGSTMVAFDGGYAIDFGSAGLWYYKGGSWTKLHHLDVEHIMASGTKLAVDFGSAVGLYEYDSNAGSWIRHSKANPDNSGNTMVVYRDGYAVDFGSLGIYTYTSGTWTRIHTLDPEHITPSGTKLAIDFGSGVGLWEYDESGTTWTRLHTLDPENTGSTMVAFDSGWVIDFGSAGLWQYKSGSWNRLHTLDVEYMTVSGSKLILDFGSVGLWEYDKDTTAWTRISTDDPDNTGNTVTCIEN